MKSQTMLVLLLAAVGIVLQTTALPLVRNRRNAPIEDEDLVVQEGEPIEINDCEAQSTYPPTFHWLFNGLFIEQGPHDNIASNLMSPPLPHVSVKAYSSFYIAHALPEHSGKYTCVADSLTKRTTRSYNVRVESVTTKKPSEESDNVRIYAWTESLMQEEGKTLYAMCRATQGVGKLAPSITWSIDGNLITENDNVKIHSNGDLEVEHAITEFQLANGLLRCTAMSDDGLREDTRDIFFYIFEAMNFDEESGDS